MQLSTDPEQVLQFEVQFRHEDVVLSPTVP